MRWAMPSECIMISEMVVRVTSNTTAMEIDVQESMDYWTMVNDQVLTNLQPAARKILLLGTEE